MSVLGCSRALTHDQAKAVILRNVLIRATDDVSVDAVSPSGEAEAIVRATVAGETTNMKFRRFDSGWTWEFVETKTGGWIAPDVAIGQVREGHRALAAAQWADKQMDAYRATAMTINLMVIYYVPNPTERLNLASWAKNRGLLVEMFRTMRDIDEQERTARIRVLTSDRQIDAWGGAMEAQFDSNSGLSVVVSAGPDKIRGNEDDLICSRTFASGFEDGRRVWNTHDAWSIPEGLDGAVMNKFFDKSSDRIEHTRVIKP